MVLRQQHLERAAVEATPRALALFGSKIGKLAFFRPSKQRQSACLIPRKTKSLIVGATAFHEEVWRAHQGRKVILAGYVFAIQQ